MIDKVIKNKGKKGKLNRMGGVGDGRVLASTTIPP